MANANIQDIVQRVTLGRTKTNDLPAFNTGDTLGVYVKVKEGEKERVQLFKGIVIKVQNGGQGRSFTVRKMSSGVGVERTFPFTSPAIDKIEVISRGKIRRSRLFYLRKLRGRAAKIESSLAFENKKQASAKKKAAAPAEEKAAE